MNLSNTVWMLSLIVFSLTSELNLYAQSDLHQTWLLNPNNFITFYPDGKIYSDNLQYFSSYTIHEDTLLIHHDYEGLSCLTRDADGNDIECPNWKLSDSKFLIKALTAEILSLQSLNTSAYTIVNNSFSDFIITASNPDLSGDTDITLIQNFDLVTTNSITLKSRKFYHAPITWQKIQLSIQYGGFYKPTTYIDMILDNEGKLTWSIKIDSMGKDYQVIVSDYWEVGTFTNQLPEAEIENLNDELNHSGFFKLNDEYPATSFHPTWIRMKIETKERSKMGIGGLNNFPYLMRAAVDSCLKLLKDQKGELAKDEFSDIAETSFYKNRQE